MNREIWSRYECRWLKCEPVRQQIFDRLVFVVVKMDEDGVEVFSMDVHDYEME